MHRLSRFIVAGALLVGTVAVISGSPASAAVPTTTCNSASPAGTVGFATQGIKLETQKPVTFNTTSGAATCNGPIVSAGHWAANFGGIFCNCNTLMGDVGSQVRFTMTWDTPINMGFTQGFARAKASARTATTTTLTYWGTFDDTAGHLYRGRAITGTVTINTSLMTVPLGDCSITSALTGGTAATTFKVY